MIVCMSRWYAATCSLFLEALVAFGYRHMVPHALTEATITCPECGHAQMETMPTDACQIVYVCKGCSGDASSSSRRLLRVLLVRRSRLSAEADRCTLSTFDLRE